MPNYLFTNFMQSEVWREGVIVGKYNPHRSFKPRLGLNGNVTNVGYVGSFLGVTDNIQGDR